MKSLYIYELDSNGNITKEVWEDIKITRDKGRIVTKRNSEYRLAHGTWKDKQYLNQVREIRYGFPNSTLSYVEYISFEDTISDETIREMKKPFISNIENQIKELKNTIQTLEDKMKVFKDK